MNQHQPKKIAHISAPGKLILCGEHAVVYGEDAIAMAISLRLKAQLWLIETQLQPSIYFKGSVNCQIFPSEIIKNGNLDFGTYLKDNNEENLSDRSKIIFKLAVIVQQANLTGLLKQSFMVDFSSEIPIGKCLGSSAAFNSVLTAVALIILSDQKKPNLIPDHETINRISKILEKVEHGNPSGIDNYLATYGGLVAYNNTKNPPFSPISDQNMLEKLTTGLNFYLVDSGIAKNTRKAVQIVRANWEKDQKYKDMIKKIGHLPRQIWTKIAGNIEHWEPDVLQMLSQNHILLRQLGVSIPQIELIVQKLTKERERSVKITGAGMGGCVLVIQSSKHSLGPIEEALPAKMERLGLIISGL